MKLESKITNITQEDLVNLLSTALYGSHFFGSAYNSADYKSLDNTDEDDCYEEKMAKILLAGKSITIYDINVEDEDDYNGNLPHHYDSDENVMDYYVTLDDIVKGIEKALNNGGWDAECAFDLINDDSCDLDLTEADNLLQIIVFGETVYG